MVRSQDTAAAADTESPMPSRSIFVLDPATAVPPAGEIAEWLLAIWQSDWNSSLPGLVLVDQRQHSLVVDHLHRRLHSCPALSLETDQVPKLVDVVRAALDGGATLIAGGSSPGPGLWLPGLFVNLLSASPLLHPQAPCGPLLAILRTSSRNPSQNILNQLAVDGAKLQIHRPAG